MEEEEEEEDEDVVEEDFLYNEIFAAEENNQNTGDRVSQWVPMLNEDGAEDGDGFCTTLTRQDYEDSQKTNSLRLFCQFFATTSYTLHGYTPLGPPKKAKKFHA